MIGTGRGVKGAELIVNRARKITGLDLALDTNNPGDGRTYRLERKGRILVRVRGRLVDFERAVDAFCEGVILGRESPLGEL